MAAVFSAQVLNTNAFFHVDFGVRPAISGAGKWFDSMDVYVCGCGFCGLPLR
jgi:hypothetical protein